MFSAVKMALKMSSETSTRWIHLRNEKQQDTDPALALLIPSGTKKKKPLHPIHSRAEIMYYPHEFFGYKMPLEYCKQLFNFDF